MEVLFVRVGEATYVAPLASLSEVLMPAALRPVPTAPGFLRGMLNLRGRVVPVLDLRERLDLPARQQWQRQNRILHVEVGGRDLGVIVDEVQRIAVLDPAQRRRLTLSGEGVEPFLGDLWEVDGALLQELTLSRLLRDAELKALGIHAALADQSGDDADPGGSPRLSSAQLAADGAGRP
jgi:purine-binding chemotaxis protein CheW